MKKLARERVERLPTDFGNSNFELSVLAEVSQLEQERDQDVSRWN
jgi:hypothetical protein